eukprot:1563580-Amphidinium_carterae.1
MDRPAILSIISVAIDVVVVTIVRVVSFVVIIVTATPFELRVSSCQLQNQAKGAPTQGTA